MSSEPLLNEGDRGEGAGGGEESSTSASSNSASSSSSSSSSSTPKRDTGKEEDTDNSCYIKFDPYRVESVQPNDTLLRDRKPSVIYEIREKGRDFCGSRPARFIARPLIVSLAVLVIFTTIVAIAVHGTRRHSDNTTTTTNNVNGDTGNSMRADVPPVSLTSRGAWYYPRGESKETISAAIRDLDLDYVVVSANADDLSDDEEEFEATLELFKEIQSVGVRPVVMTLQGATFTYISNLQRSLALVDTSLRLCNALETCNEIHVDIEPHTLDAWKDGDLSQKQAILDEMTAVIKAVNDHVRLQTNGEVTLSTAVTWWMLSSPGLVLQFDPEVKFYIMAYGQVGGSASEILRMIGKKDTLGLRGEQYNVGIGIKEFQDAKGATQAAEVIEQSIQDQLFGGVCFYSLNFAAGEDD